MGKAINEIAKKRGHHLVDIIDNENDWIYKAASIKIADVAFEFTQPKAAPTNILKCFSANIPVVCGTTGWLNEYDKIKEKCLKENQSLFISSNFSIGVNIVMEINKQLAILMNNFTEYDVKIQETHHIHKLDAPSGTAIMLANDIIKHITRKKAKNYGKSNNQELLNIESFRENEIIGIHNIIYESETDIIELKHTAKNRNGLAIGAVIAAEWLIGKKGIFQMYDLLGFGNKLIT